MISTGSAAFANGSTMTECTVYCKKMYGAQTSTSYNISAIFENLCFCGDQTMTNLIHSSNETCDLFEGQCPFTGFGNSIFTVMQALTDDNLRTESPAEILEAGTQYTIKIATINLQSMSHL